MVVGPIGTTKGPGESAHEFLFVSPDQAQQLKHGEFVYYESTVEGLQRRILGRITGREPLRLYPDSLMANPAVPPARMAALLGYTQPSPTLYQITVSILGYYDGGRGFVNPRIAPEVGAPIYLAPDDLLAGVLCRAQPKESAAVHIGSLLSRPSDAVPITLDARGFTSTHMAIIASTGSGKSYLASVIIEELMSPHIRAAILIIDPHGEYGTLDRLQGHKAFSEGDYAPSVRIIKPGDIKVRVGTLTLADLRYLLPDLSERMHNALQNAFRDVVHEKRDRWTRQDLMDMVRSNGTKGGGDEDSDDKLDPTASALLWRIEGLFESSIFDDNQGMPLDRLFQPGQCSVLQLNDTALREQQVIVATLLRRLNQARMQTVRGLAKEGDENHLPYPGFVLIEEAHNYAPASGDVMTTQILKQILSEGRKFGVAVALISQRPGRLDSDLLSQCMTQCIMRIINPIDQARVAESVESVGRDLLSELPALSRGQVIIAGASVNTPVLAQVRSRLTPHGAEDPDAPGAWMAYFDQEATAQRKRESAPPGDSGKALARLRIRKH